MRGNQVRSQTFHALPILLAVCVHVPRCRLFRASCPSEETSRSVLLPAVGVLTVGMPDLQSVDDEAFSRQNPL